MTALGTLSLAGSLAGCTGTSGGGDSVGEDGGGGDGGDSSRVTIEMTNDLTFEPAELAVDVGETVTWTNVGAVEHTVTAYEDRIPADAAYFASGGFDGEQAARDAFPNRGGIAGGESYEVTFERAGTYEYLCIPHEGTGMTGSIDVS